MSLLQSPGLRDIQVPRQLCTAGVARKLRWHLHTPQAVSDSPRKQASPACLHTGSQIDQPAPSLTHTPLLCEEQQETGDTFEYFSHDYSGGGKEAVPRQCASISDAKDEGGVLDHQHS